MNSNNSSSQINKEIKFTNCCGIQVEVYHIAMEKMKTGGRSFGEKASEQDAMSFQRKQNESCKKEGEKF